MAESPIPRSLLWTLVTGSAALLVGGAYLTGLRLAPAFRDALLFYALIAAFCVTISTNPNSWQDKLVRSVEHVFVHSSLMMIGAIGSYVVASMSGPFVDDSLAAADRLMGFDWVAVYQATIASDFLRQMGRMAYGSIFFSPLILLLWLTWTNRIRRVQLFIISHGVALAITLAIFLYFPAKAAFVHHLGAPAGYMPFTGVHHIQTIIALQNGEITEIGGGPLYGLITFPSFHATSAILFIWAAWPSRVLRLPMLLINGAMLAATPVEGTHYLIDVVAGAIIAVAALWITFGAGNLWPALRAIRTAVPAIPAAGAES